MVFVTWNFSEFIFKLVKRDGRIVRLSSVSLPMRTDGVIQTFFPPPNITENIQENAFSRFFQKWLIDVDKSVQIIGN